MRKAMSQYLTSTREPCDDACCVQCKRAALFTANVQHSNLLQVANSLNKPGVYLVALLEVFDTPGQEGRVNAVVGG
jgi:hypothetical protein